MAILIKIRLVLLFFQHITVFLPRFFPAVRSIFYSETQNKRMPLPSGLGFFVFKTSFIDFDSFKNSGNEKSEVGKSLSKFSDFAGEIMIFIN